MTVQTLRDILTKLPFEPFRLVMSSGQSYDVRHPDTAFLTRIDLLVGIDVADDGVPSSFKICPLQNVTDVEPLSPSSTGAML